MGIAAGFLIPPLVISDVDNLDVISHDLWILFVAVAVVSSVFALAILFGKYTHYSAIEANSYFGTVINLPEIFYII